VLEGYGQTESSAGLTAQAAWDVGQVGHVGFPLTCVELKVCPIVLMLLFALFLFFEISLSMFLKWITCTLTSRIHEARSATEAHALAKVSF
jgi:hypothetical protein